MTLPTADGDRDVPTEGPRAAPIVIETYWGYVIRPSELFLERAALLEIVSGFVGVFVFCAAYGHWLLPGSDLSPEALPMKLVSTVLFAALGASLVWIGRKGMVQEMHIDTVKQEVRLVQRNRSGDGQLVGLYAFEDVSSVVIRRSKSALSPSKLGLRLAGSGSLIEIVPSDEDELLPIRNRLIGDMSPRLRQPEPSLRIHAPQGALA